MCAARRAFPDRASHPAATMADMHTTPGKPGKA